MNNNDRRLQRNFEMIFKKAEIDQRLEAERKREAEKKCQNDNGTPTTKKPGTKPPGLG